MKLDLDALVARHVASSMLGQLALDDLVGAERSWNADLERATLRFGDGPPHPVQLLGTESYADRTWRWAWANAESGLPPALVAASARLRDFGAEMGVPELTAPEVSLDRAGGHVLAAVARGVLGAGSHYRGPYGAGPEPTGAAFFLLTDFPAPAQVDASAARLLRAVELVISQYGLDHRALLAGLAADLGLPLRGRLDGSGPTTVTITSQKGEDVEFELDLAGRIARMAARVAP